MGLLDYYPLSWLNRPTKKKRERKNMCDFYFWLENSEISLSVMTSLVCKWNDRLRIKGPREKQKQKLFLRTIILPKMPSYPLKPFSQAHELVQLHIPLIPYLMQNDLSLTALLSTWEALIVSCTFRVSYFKNFYLFFFPTVCPFNWTSSATSALKYKEFLGETGSTYIHFSYLLGSFSAPLTLFYYTVTWKSTTTVFLASYLTRTVLNLHCKSVPRNLVWLYLYKWEQRKAHTV